MTQRAQIHLTETIAVLFIFFVLILFGIIFYYHYQQVSIKEKNEELLAARAIDTTMKTLFLPELGCSRNEAEIEDNCFDLMKLRHANETIRHHHQEYYFALFSYARISVQQLYPEEEKQEFVLYDFPKPEYTNKEPTFFVVSLRDQTKGEGEPQYGLGYIKVEVYS